MEDGLIKFIKIAKYKNFIALAGGHKNGVCPWESNTLEKSLLFLFDPNAAVPKPPSVVGTTLNLLPVRNLVIH